MKPRQITTFFACVIGILAVICFIFPADGITVGGKSFYFPSMKKLIDANQSKHIDIEEESVEFAVPAEVTELNDSIICYQSYVDSSTTRFWLPDSTYFDSFWEDAEQAAGKGRIVRILHYGDSQIESDRLSAQLRSYMQKTFGGGGPGMVPAHTTTPTSAFWLSTSGNLTHLASFGDSTVSRSRGNYGVMMQSFRMSGSASITISATTNDKADDATKHFSRIRLVYNNRGGLLHATLSDRKSKYRVAQEGTEGVGSLLWTLDTSTSKINLSLSGNADLYCITVDDGPGVAVDNIPMRGCSGQQFTLVTEEYLCQGYAQLDVGLIILQFGGNSVPYIHTSKQVSTYCKSIGRQIDYLHRCCPHAKILFIGPSDMSTRHQDNLQTYPALPMLIDSLIATANSHDAAYWSIYHAMGGWNSMQDWYRKGLSGSDFIHFTPRGAEIMGNRLAEAFENNHRLFTMRRRLTTIQ